MSTLSELVKDSPNIAITVNLEDLRKICKEMIDDTKKQLEDEIRAKNAEVYLTIEEVSELLKVDKSTLWRWNKKGYLSPVEIGGKRRYLKSQIDKMLEGGIK